MNISENSTGIRIKPKTASILYKLFFVIIIARLVWNFLFGFRWPSEYVMTCSVFTYDFGFVPRSLVTSALKLIFGSHVYSLKFLYILILGTGLITLGCFIYFAYYFTIKTMNPIGTLLLLWYSLSIYSAYFSHEMGYFEQYGFVLICAVMILPIRFKKNRSYSILYAFLMLVSLLISETNAFLICPVFLALTAYKILTGIEQDLRDCSFFERGYDKRGLAKELLFALCINVPNIAYCLWSGLHLVPVERIENVKNMIRSHTHLLDNRLNEVGNAFCYGRTNNTYVSDVNFKVWNWQLLCYLLLIIFLIAAVLIFAGYWHRAIFYVVSTSFMMFCAYIVNFIAWDQERFKFGAAMMITFFSIFIIKDLGAAKLVLNKDIFYICTLITVVMICIMDFRLGLFDGAAYNASLTQFKETLRSTWMLNY